MFLKHQLLLSIDCKITVLNFKNKIFIFNLKVKLEGRLKAVIFSN